MHINLTGMSVKEILEIYKTIPRHDHSLDLRGNGLAYRKPEEVIAILKGIPLHIRHVHLGSNSLGALAGSRHLFLVEMMQSLHEDIISLDLSSNGFGLEANVTNLAVVMKNIPANIEHVNLNWNEMRKTSFWSNKTDDELFKIVIAIPKTVKKVEFLSNGMNAEFAPRLLGIIHNYFPSFKFDDNRDNQHEDQHENSIYRYVVKKCSNFTHHSIFSAMKDKKAPSATPLQEKILEGFTGFKR